MMSSPDFCQVRLLIFAELTQSDARVSLTSPIPASLKLIHPGKANLKEIGEHRSL